MQNLFHAPTYELRESRTKLHNNILTLTSFTIFGCTIMHWGIWVAVILAFIAIVLAIVALVLATQNSNSNATGTTGPTGIPGPVGADFMTRFNSNADQTLTTGVCILEDVDVNSLCGLN
jgi:hypothetical protein